MLAGVLTGLSVLMVGNRIEVQNCWLLLLRCVMLVEVNKIEVAGLDGCRLCRFWRSLKRRELVVIVLIEQVCRGFPWLDWCRGLGFLFLLLLKYYWGFFDCPSLRETVRSLSASDLALENRDRVRNASRCVPFLDILVLDEPLDIFQARVRCGLSTYQVCLLAVHQLLLPILVALLIAQHQQIRPARLPGVQLGRAHPRDAGAQGSVGS